MPIPEPALDPPLPTARQLREVHEAVAQARVAIAHLGAEADKVMGEVTDLLRAYDYGSYADQGAKVQQALTEMEQDLSNLEDALADPPDPDDYEEEEHEP